VSFIEAQVAVQVIDRTLDRLRQIVRQFPADKVWERPAPDTASLGNLVCHVAGSMRDWVENGIGEGSWERDRGYEFAREDGLEPTELIQHLDETRELCDRFFSAISQDTWTEQRTFRGKSHVVRDIALQQIGHVAYHVGQAALLRRVVADLEPTP
jgi:uncharacterized damage-inducible protein DinB